MVQIIELIAWQQYWW